MGGDRSTYGIDVQFEFEAFPRNDHEATVAVASFYIDRAPVGMQRFAAFLSATGYEPEDPRGFLREWPDWRAHRFPPGNETVPVTGVSLEEARTFCSWAGGRLPTSIEWQYAAQDAGNASMIYPWGDEDDQAKRPPPVLRGLTPAPEDSERYRQAGGANTLGVYDLVGNVWQYTDSEYADEHTRFVLLRGGSLYQPAAASDFQNWYFGSSDPAARRGGATRLDRHAKYFLFNDAYERAATVGFRCAYNRIGADWQGAAGSLAGSLGQTDPSQLKDVARALLVTVVLLVGARVAWIRFWRRAKGSRRARGSAPSASAAEELDELQDDDL